MIIGWVCSLVKEGVFYNIPLLHNYFIKNFIGSFEELSTILAFMWLEY